jgi:carotenoid cleavage dioxygenase
MWTSYTSLHPEEIAMGMMDRAVEWGARHLARRVPRSGSNPWLEGRFAPVRQERTETELRVSGRLPVELEGLYARIGPNPMEVRNPGAYHWFVGDGMVHGVRLRDGKAQWYRNRWVGTDSVQQRLGRPTLPGTRRGVIDVVNTNVIGHAGRLWALVESGPTPIELDHELNSLRRGLFDSAISAAFSAHPHRDPETGALHAVCYDALAPMRVQHIAVDSNAQVSRVENIPVKHGPMIHDCAITRSSVVILDLPVTFSVAEMLRGYPLPYRWNPRHAARVGLLPKNGRADDVRWFDVDPCFVFHPCNAFDLPDGGAVLDVVVHPRIFHESHVGPEVGDISFERWTLDAATRRVQRRVLGQGRQEFPRCDERRTGREYRYAYVAGFDPMGGAQPLVRYDVQKGAVARHGFGPQRTPGEFVFVPRNEAAAEDDGWLIGLVHAVGGETTELVVLDAKDFEGEPVATVHLPAPVPMGFHGNWIAGG